MSSEFDPYHKWLGIAPKEQPPHLYRLLGLSLFETDADAIENAADQRMAHLRSFQTGKNSDHSQRLLNEVAAAKRRLLNPDEKEIYDDALRRTLKKRKSAAETAPRSQQRSPSSRENGNGPKTKRVGVPRPTLQGSSVARPRAAALARPATAGADSAANPQAAAAPIRTGVAARRRRRKKPAYQQPAVLIVAGLLVAGGIALAVIASQGGFGRSSGTVAEGSPESNRKAKQGNTSIRKPGRGKTGPTNSSTGGNKTAVAAPGKNPAAKPADGADEGVNSPDDKPTDSRPSPGSDDPEQMVSTDRLDQKLDLLAGGEIDRKVVFGKWTADAQQGAIENDPAEASLYRFDARVPASYDLTFVVTRLNETDGGFGIVAPHKSGRVGILLDHGAGDRAVSGIHSTQSAIGAEDRIRYTGRVLPPSKPVTVRIQIRSGAVAVTADGRQILHYAGELGSLSEPTYWNVPDGGGIFLWAGSTRFRVSELAVQPPAPDDSIAQAPSGDKRPGPNGPRTPSGSPPVAGATRMPLPAATEQERVRKQLEEIYKVSTIKENPKRLELAQEMTRMASAAKDKPAERFVLLQTALNLAQQAGEVDLALKTVEEVGRHFDVNTGRAKQVVFESLAKDANDLPTIRRIVEQSQPLIREAASADDYATALAVAKAAHTATVRPAGAPLRPVAYKQRQLVQNLQTRWRRFQAALERLDADMNDAAAHSFVARQYAARGDVEKALTHAAKGSSPRVAPLAARDLAMDDEADSAQQVELADAWWNVAAAVSDQESKQLALARAGHWYEKARPQATSPIEIAKLDKRLAATSSAVEAMESPELFSLPEIPAADAASKTAAATPEKKIEFAELKVPAARWERFAPLRVDETVKPLSDDRWTAVPPNLAGLQFLRRWSRTASLQFEVTKPGVVLLAVTNRWGYTGRGGDALQNATTRGQFLAQGWRPVGAVTDSSRSGLVRTVYARVFRAGDRYYLRTERYEAPILIVDDESKVDLGDR